MILNHIYEGDCLKVLKTLPNNSIDCCVTSPPYYGLRDYGMGAQIGMEETPEKFIKNLVKVFTQVKRVLKNDGTLWLNIGDSYASQGKNRTVEQAISKSKLNGGLKSQTQILKQQNKITKGLKAKDLIGIPWMLAFALRKSGWYLRQDIIWHKKNCMPESVKDRCTKNHEYIFLLSKSSTYFFDETAIMEDAVWDLDGTGTIKRKLRQSDDNKCQPGIKEAGIRKVYENGKTGTAFKEVTGKRNKRSVWSYPTAQFAEAHFATFPQELIVDCIKAGCPVNGVVLDPFFGAGTTGLVARKLNRNYIGIELNPEYITIAENRLSSNLGLFK